MELALEHLIKIDSILFYVKNLDKSAEFYQNVLGMKKVWMDKKTKMIGFIFPQTDAEIVIHSDPALPNPSFSFLVENVEEFCKYYHNEGYQILEGPFEVRTGKFAILADPDGNEIPIIDLTKFDNSPRYDI